MRRINDEKMNIGTMGKHLYKSPNSWFNWKILVADVHRAQQTDGVKALLKKKNTELVTVRPVCTSRIQPLDVSFNKPFKDVVRSIFRRTCNGILKGKSVPLKEEY